MSLEMVLKPSLRLWDSSEPWSEPLFTNGKNMEECWTFPGAAGPTKMTPRAQRRLIQEVIKEPRTTFKELQASLASIKVSVYDSTIRKRLGKKLHPWETSKIKPQLTKKNTNARLTFAPQKYQIKSLLLSHHHSTCALVSEILESVLQTVQKQFTYRQYILTQKTMCRMHIHILSTHSVISWSPPWLLGKYSVDWWDKSWTFWKLCVPLHVA